MWRVLALDPSFRNTGYAVIERDGPKERVVTTGVIKTEARDKKTRVRAADQRLEQIQIMVKALKDIIGDWQPALLVAELPSSGGKSANAVASMAIAQAVCGAVVAYEGLPAEWVTPMENKKCYTGKRNASKEDMMSACVRTHPALKKEYTHTKGQYKGQLRGEFEHVADALGAYEAAKQNSPVMKVLEGVSR